MAHVTMKSYNGTHYTPHMHNAIKFSTLKEFDPVKILKYCFLMYFIISLHNIFFSAAY